jgi:hypothetical protein
MKIKLVVIGHADRVVDFDYLLKHNSKYFQYTEIERINNLPSCEKNDGYLDVVYSTEEMTTLLKDIQFDGLCIAIMNYRFDDNFYMHRVASNKVCISIFGIESILSKKKISIENFIVKNTYEAFVFCKLYNNLLSPEVYKFPHLDTRGCLFDMNGDKDDIIYNTESPIICDECKSKINQKSIPNNFIRNIQNELEKIKKPAIKRIEIFIKQYPLFSILLTFMFSTVINVISNYIWETISK